MKIENNGMGLESRLAEELQRQLRAIPFLKQGRLSMQARAADKEPGGDFQLKLRLPNEQIVLAAEVKPKATPRLIRQLIPLLQAEQLKTGRYPVLGAPYISEESARLCKQAGVGYVDLAGNCYLSFNTVYIEKGGGPNPWPERRELRSLFSPKAENVLRILWSRPGANWKTQQLADAAGVSLGQVHKVKQKLLDREWAMQTEQGLVLMKPFELLESWQAVYEPSRHQRQEYYSMSSPGQLETGLAEAAEAAGIPFALTAFAGAARWSGGVRYNRVHAYIQETEQAILAQLGLKPVDSGGNLVLLRPYEDGILASSFIRKGVPVVQPVQLYLDLMTQKGRGEEAAERVLKEVLEAAWQRAEATIPEQK